MFTIRFIKHAGAGHKSYSVQAYSTDVRDDHVRVDMELKDGTMYVEEVGPTQPYDIAYVSNDSGKTVDKIVL